MSCTIKLVQGDTRPQLKFVITDESTGDAVNMAGATPRLKFRAAGSTTLLFTREGILLAGLELENGQLNTAAPYDVAGVGGRVAFSFIAGDLEIPAGSYEGEIEITFSDSSVQTVYKTHKFSVREDF